MKVPDHPFQNIALCCSGGGYRAAAFHLGAMSYLHKLNYQGLPLIEKVKAISTVSGGTISGVVYAQQKQQNKSFEEIYHFILRRLRTLDLIKDGLEKINPGAIWENNGKRKNLINAFAEIYNQKFTNGGTFSIFDNMSHSHLEEVMFNATEFNHGLIFRFQNEGFFGNRYFNIKKDAAREVKLGDIIAASSCFPGGFEPIEWPNDFLHDQSPYLETNYGGKTSAGLMDGGIYDNQGIDSIILSEQRKGANPYDLIIITDVTSPYMEPFHFLAEKANTGWRKWSFQSIKQNYQSWVKKLQYIFLLLALLFGFAPLLVGYSNHILTGICITLLVLMLIGWFSLRTIKKRIPIWLTKGIDYLTREIPPFYRQKLGALDLSQFTFGRIEPLLFDRIASLISLLMNVFLKTVRRLVYGRLYEPDRYKFRRLSNLIREITESDYDNKLKMNEHNPYYYQNLVGSDPRIVGEYQHVFGEELKKVAEEVARFGTTLWFTDQDKMDKVLDKLLACGQFSMCFNLLVYLTELKYTPDNGYKKLSSETKMELDHLWDQCIDNWLKFKTEPLFMVKELKTPIT